jgi:hypothetical protein
MSETPVPVGEFSMQEAKRLQAACQARGIEVRLMTEPDQCGSCSPKILVTVREADLGSFQAFLLEERAQSFGISAEELARAVSNGGLRSDAVFDPEKEEATCPACGTLFSTRLSECPDCGLGFGAV